MCRALAADRFRQLRVLVPSSMEQLDESHAAFGESPCKQAIRCIGAWLARVLTIKLERAGRLIRHVGQLGNRRLHPERHLVLRDSRRDLRIARLRELRLIQFIQVVQESPAHLRIDAGRIREVQHGIRSRPELHPLIPRRQKTAAPQSVREGLISKRSAARRHHDICREILVLTPKTICQPRSDTGTPCKLKSGLEERDPRDRG